MRIFPAMAIASRLLYRSRKLAACQAILHHQRPLQVRCFVGEANLPEVPYVREVDARLSEKGVPWNDVLSFIKSSCNELKGPHHCWLNNIVCSREFFDQDGTFLVLVNAYLEDPTIGHHECMAMFERVKLLQQRYRKLNVFGLQCGFPLSFSAAETQIVQTVMGEYVTFPILLLDKDFMKGRNGACYLLFDGCTNRFIYHKLDAELDIIIKAIEELNLSWKGNSVELQNANIDRRKQYKTIKEPSACSSFKNLILYYPGCISIDEEGKRIFISDSNHHRIIVTDIDGKILECIGSSPGFEDGEFESAKLFRPAGLFYHSAEDCLYFADSENHAVRRANLERRVLETVYPVSVKKNSGMWSWILDKLGMPKEADADADTESEEFNWESLNFPWHLIQLGDTDLLVINRSFQMSWIMSLTTGEIKKIIRGTSSAVEICEHVIMEKMSLLKDMYGKCLPQRLAHSLSPEKFPYSGLMSSLAKFQNDTFFCDSAGHRVLKCDRETRTVSFIKFSELGALGLPYWLICPLERVPDRGHLRSTWNEHLQSYSVLPGRCLIHVNVDIPKGTRLAAPLEESCIWRQVRGSGAEIYESEEVATNVEKVGVAQQWFDELDNLAFTNAEVESTPVVEEHSIHERFQDKDSFHFDCALNISPGTAEVVVSAVLYLKLNGFQHQEEGQYQEERRVLDSPNLAGSDARDEACSELVSDTCRTEQDCVFMKPLHLRIRLECGDHPTAPTTKETIITDSTLEVNVSMD